MAITQVGSQVDLPFTSGNNSGTVSSTITVPSGTELVVVALGCFHHTVNYRSCGFLTFTKGGVDTRMHSIGNWGDHDVGRYQGAMWYLLAPDIGTNKTLNFNWLGSGAPDDSHQAFAVTFWQGVDTVDPVRSTGGEQRGGSGFPATTPTMTAVSGDLIVAAATGYNGSGTPSFDSWTNLTVLTTGVVDVTAVCQFATGSPSGNTSVAVASGTNIIEPTINAAVLRQPFSKGTTSIQQTGSTLQIGVSNDNNVGTVSTTITVPADAELVIVALSAFVGSALYLSGGTVTFTKGGVDTAMTLLNAGDASTAFHMGVMWGLALPDTGASKSLKWDWVGSGTSGGADLNWSITFWKGVDTSNPYRDGDHNETTSLSNSIPTLTAQNGDLIVAFNAFSDVDATDASSVSWIDVDGQATIARQGFMVGAWATRAPTGDQSVTVVGGSNMTGYSSVMAVVLKPASVPSGGRSSPNESYVIGGFVIDNPTVVG